MAKMCWPAGLAPFTVDDCKTSVRYYTDKVMIRRRFNYYCGLISRYYIFGFPGILFDVAVRWSCPFKLVSGMRVMDPRPETRNGFIDLVDRALALIARTDPVRFRRVQ